MDRITQYVENWKDKGYENDIPDDVPREIDGLAPSYRTIAECILKNDLNLHELGFERKVSKWYSILKKIELNEKPPANKNIR